jgi:hypothetical protein
MAKHCFIICFLEEIILGQSNGNKIKIALGIAVENLKQ